MIHIVLEDFYHLTLVLWRIFVEIFYEWYEIRIARICYLLLLDKFQNMIVALELFLSSVNNGFHSFVIFFV